MFLKKSLSSRGANIYPEVTISSYPGTEVPGSFLFCRAEILNSGGFVQKYSDQGVSCKNIGQLQPPGTGLGWGWGGLWLIMHIISSEDRSLTIKRA